MEKIRRSSLLKALAVLVLFLTLPVIIIFAVYTINQIWYGWFRFSDVNEEIDKQISIITEKKADEAVFYYITASQFPNKNDYMVLRYNEENSNLSVTFEPEDDYNGKHEALTNFECKSFSNKLSKRYLLIYDPNELFSYNLRDFGVSHYGIFELEEDGNSLDELRKNYEDARILCQKILEDIEAGIIDDKDFIKEVDGEDRVVVDLYDYLDYGIPLFDYRIYVPEGDGLYEGQVETAIVETLRLKDNLTAEDEYFESLMIRYRKIIGRMSVPVVVAAVLLFIISSAFLAASLGWVKEKDEIQINRFARVPFELILLVTGLAWFGFALNAFIEPIDDIYKLIGTTLLACVAYVMLYCTTIIRIKSKSFFKYTLLSKLLRCLKKCLKGLGKFLVNSVKQGKKHKCFLIQYFVIFIMIVLIQFCRMYYDGIDYYEFRSTVITELIIAILLAMLLVNSKWLKPKEKLGESAFGRALLLSGQVIIKLGRACREIYTNSSLVAVYFTFMVSMFGLELLGAYYYSMETAHTAILLMLQLGLVLWLSVTKIETQKIMKATAELAKGNLGYKVNTKTFSKSTRKYAEDLNRINDGIQNAVTEQLKSERLKAELITNVSHDIKTPLTSIISYVDLLAKEEIENEKACEYIEVLNRQSERLKKLIQDLIDASKAATGNVEVNLSRLDAGVIVSQVLGEYEDRLNRLGIKVITSYCDNGFVTADGRHMWRILDNIISNMCKYSQENSRAYIDITEDEGNVIIICKNISKEQLNITGDELMERFVRGDKSRNTEGSGLGLSIAQSLAELQKGKLQVMVDGDLFKVKITLPKA